MTNLQPLLLYACVAMAIIMTPGLDTMNVLRSSASEGSRHGIMTALGIGFGCLLWGSSVALGVGGLLAKWPVALLLLQWIGATYLIWIGSRTLLSLRRAASGMTLNRSSDHIGSGYTALRRGFTSNVLNPKVGLFYVTMLPRFIPSSKPAISYALVLAGRPQSPGLVLQCHTGILDQRIGKPRRAGSLSPIGDAASGLPWALVV